MLTLLARGDLILDFDFAGQITAVQALATQYAERPMDLADACLVRMTEDHPSARGWCCLGSRFVNLPSRGG